MKIGSIRKALFMALTALCLSPIAAQAQSAFTGVVKDTSGAVLPGVSVEAASDPLIKKTRSVVTDADGGYRLVDLRPGTYSLTVSLEGFSTNRREGIELSSDFTMTLNSELRVGSLEETLTVTGAAPTVDVQSTTKAQVLNREALDAIPTSASGVWNSPIYTVGSVKFTSAVSSRLLFETGFSTNYTRYNTIYQEGIERERNSPEWFTTIHRSDNALQTSWGAGTGQNGMSPDRFALMASMSCVSGAHNIKVGVQDTWGRYNYWRNANGDLRAIFNNGVPFQATILNTPLAFGDKLKAAFGVLRRTPGPSSASP